ncbi:MAG: hypothetical protein R3Y07_06160 [Eubacteriales bacterium]
MTLSCEKCHGTMTLSPDKTTATCDFCNTTVLISQEFNTSGFHKSLNEIQEERDRELYTMAVQAYSNIKTAPIGSQFEIYPQLITWLAPLATKNYENSQTMLEDCKKSFEPVKKTIMKRRRTALALFWCIILSMGMFLHINKSSEENAPYKEATVLYENGEYYEAATAFLEIRDYKDSGKLAIECFYYYGEELMFEQNYVEAIKVFTIVEYYEKTEVTLKECRYLYGLELIEMGEIETALDMFTLVGDYKEAKSLSLELNDTYLAQLVEEGSLHLLVENLANYSSETIATLQESITKKGIELAQSTMPSRAVSYFYALYTYFGVEEAKYVWSALIQDPVAIGEYFMLGVHTDGTVSSTGFNDKDQGNVGNWSNIVGVAAGFQHSIGLRADGTAVATGMDYDSRCNVTGWTDMVQVAAGDHHSSGLKSDGTVISQGSFLKIKSDSWENIIQIDSSGGATVGLCFDGTVVTNDHTSEREEIAEWKDIVQVSTSAQNIIALDKYGQIFVAGSNNSNQNEISDDWEGVVKVASGSGHNILLFEDGRAISYGNNRFGTCDTYDWENVVDIVGDEMYSIGLKSDGTAYLAGLLEVEMYEMISGYYSEQRLNVDKWRNLAVDPLANVDFSW